jgi:septum formation protein
MRALSAAEVRAYVAADAPLSSCGAYKFEGLGRHLFTQVVGDHDVVQGLALVPLLTQLHALKVIALA